MATFTMGVDKHVLTYSMLLQNALASGNCKAVKAGTADDQCTVCTSAGEDCLGVITGQNDGDTIAAGSQVTVVKIGLVRLLAGNTISRGDKLTVTATGTFDVATTAQNVCGTAEESAVAGNYFWASINFVGMTVL